MTYLLPLIALMFFQAQDPWKPLQFLIGEWVGEGAGSPGESAGECSFTFDLEHKVIIRKSYAASPKARHEDLLVVYLEPDLKAIYFDNEGHTIHYKIEATADMVRFLSDEYRLTYRKAGENKLAMDFDIRPPGKPLSNYLHATLRKK